jgi:CheY-like chemotaxis protein/HPt (histidine-containing phosphotransfer) domain-containing protein
MTQGKLYFVDDVEYDRILISKYLFQSGYDCEVFTNGTELISAIADVPEATILVDIEMPFMNGLDIARKIRGSLENKSKRFTLIGLTGHCECNVLDEIAESGFDDYMSKPVTKTDLINKISRYVKSALPDCEVTENNKESSQTLYSLDCLDIDDEEFMKSIIQMFLQNTPESIQQLRLAYEDKDWPLVRNIAHKLKPHFLYFGIQPVVDALQETENIASCLQGFDHLPELLSCIERVSSKALKQLGEKFYHVDPGSDFNSVKS